MILYIALFFILGLPIVKPTKIAVRFNKKRYDGRTVYGCFVFVLLGLISALREGVGGDYWTYRNSLIDYKNGCLYAGLNYEWGFMKLIALLSKITVTGQIIIVVCSLVTTGIFVYVFLKYSENVWLSTFLFYVLYFYANSFNGIRTWIAIAIVMLSIESLINRKILKYMFVILIASSFHTLAIVMIPFYFITNKIVIKVLYICACLSLIGTIIYYKEIYTILLEVFPKYAVYKNATGYGSLWNLVLLIYNLLLIKMAYKKEKEDEKQFNIYEAACLMAIFFSLLANINSLMIRFSWMFFSFSLLSIPFCFNRIRGSYPQKKMLKLGFYVLSVLVFFIYLFANNGSIIPYKIYDLL